MIRKVYLVARNEWIMLENNIKRNGKKVELKSHKFQLSTVDGDSDSDIFFTNILCRKSIQVDSMAIRKSFNEKTMQRN